MRRAIIGFQSSCEGACRESNECRHPPVHPRCVSDEGFEVFCADYFRGAQAEFSSSLSLRIKAQRLTEYCQNRGLLDNLLVALRKERSQPYVQQLVPNLIVLESPFRLELVRVPAGEFLMGSDPARDHDAQEDEQPQHRVYVAAFYIGRVPITNAQYAAYARATGRENKAGSPSDKEDHPVVNVTWQEAVDFCDWLSQATGQLFRLPTEADWEKAARGTDGPIYPWGDEWDEKRLNSGEGGAGGTTPAGQYSPAGDSPYGVADMAGNVFEWVAAWYGEDEYKDHTRLNSPVKDPTGPANGTRRVFRGGSWYYEQFSARAAYRDRGDPEDRYFDVGFRVVLGAAPVP